VIIIRPSRSFHGRRSNSLNPRLMSGSADMRAFASCSVLVCRIVNILTSHAYSFTIVSRLAMTLTSDYHQLLQSHSLTITEGFAAPLTGLDY
jgi:hypothetical protein